MNTKGTVTIDILSRFEAGEILCSSEDCATITWMVSIGDDDTKIPDGYDNVPNKLRLTFEDTLDEKRGPTEEDVQRIIALAEQLRGTEGRILIHCEAGISRSTAAALIMLACWLGPGGDQESMERVRDIVLIADPNRRMVEFADTLLGRNGELVAVLGGEDIWDSIYLP